MKVLLVQVEDDWTEFPNKETKVFADTEKGFSAAMDFVQASIPWEENHMKIYFKNCTNKIPQDTRTLLKHILNEEDSISSYNCKEKFPAKFYFCIQRTDVEEE
jgi:hypothetical protein